MDRKNECVCALMSVLLVSVLAPLTGPFASCPLAAGIGSSTCGTLSRKWIRTGFGGKSMHIGCILKGNSGRPSAGVILLQDVQLVSVVFSMQAKCCEMAWDQPKRFCVFLCKCYWHKTFCQKCNWVYFVLFCTNKRKKYFQFYAHISFFFRLCHTLLFSYHLKKIFDIDTLLIRQTWSAIHT